MEKFTIEEKNLINSLTKPINNIDMSIVNSIINKMILNKEYMDLINLLNNLYDFANIPQDIVNKLIDTNNKECISFFLNNEDILYFLTNTEKNKLKDFINVKEIYIKLPESYKFYYDLLFKQDLREWHSNNKETNNSNIIEHNFTKYNQYLNGFKIIETKKLGVIVSYINYSNYDLTYEEQILKAIDYINSYGFNLEKNIDNNILDKSLIYN